MATKTFCDKCGVELGAKIVIEYFGYEFCRPCKDNFKSHIKTFFKE